MVWAGTAQSVQRLAMVWTVRGSNPSGGKIFHTCPDWQWGPPNLLYNGYWVSYPGVKWPERGIDHPPSSSAKVKERVELYLCSPSGPLWPVLGWTWYLVVYGSVNVWYVPKLHFFWVTLQNMETVPTNCCKLNTVPLTLYISCLQKNMVTYFSTYRSCRKLVFYCKALCNMPATHPLHGSTTMDLGRSTRAIITRSVASKFMA